ncbi:glycosyltransferase [Bradyrhizobium barranii]|uniref:glycosyltransferase n=1 Tax=Bradyrhizobium TaxID=374 RepID=UPI0033995BE0
MRVFQNSGVYPSYRPRFDELASGSKSFRERRDAFLKDRFAALHFLEPVLEGFEEAFFTNADDEVLQRFWARENGLASNTSLEDILLAQIEHHKTDVFYNLDPVRFPSAFLRKLPGCVRTTLCWRAAPSGSVDLTAYGAVVGNFPSILDFWRNNGCRAELFFPAIDPVMREYGQQERSIDVLFVGGYSRHHSGRAKALEQVAGLARAHDVVFHLDASRLTRLAESPIGRLVPGLGRHRRPRAVASIARPPVFGRRLYELLGASKIVFNGAVDMAGTDRGNMRCFEAMGCGALLVSDAGNYAAGMVPGDTIQTYASWELAVPTISHALEYWPQAMEIAARGRSELSQIYTKGRQWRDFKELVAQL